MRSLQWLALLLLTCPLGQAQALPTASGAESQASPFSLYVRVQLENSVKISALKPGDVVEGKLAQGVYSGDRELFAAGSAVQLTVDKVARRKRERNDHWPWVVQAFTPRHENYPTFQSATVLLPDSRNVALQVSLISIKRESEVRAKTKNSKADGGEAGKSRSKEKVIAPIVTLEAAIPANAFEASTVSATPAPVTLAAGTRARVVLLGGVSASKSHSGDLLQARLVEPVRLDSKVVLPEGTLLSGKVVQSVHPRMLSRAGSLRLAFTDLTVPGGVEVPAAASIAGAELDARSHTWIDPEGKLQGGRPGKAWMLIHAGVSAGLAKVADDGTQLLVEALIETATDASTAGTARIAAAGVSGFFMLTRHGRDVVLPRLTEMDIVFDRPVALFGAQARTEDVQAGAGSQ
jgi:hypothetical protein